MKVSLSTLCLGVDRPCIVWQPKRKHLQEFQPVTWPNHLAVPWFFPELQKPFVSQLYTVVGGGIWKSKEPMRYLQQYLVTRHINCCIPTACKIFMKLLLNSSVSIHCVSTRKLPGDALVNISNELILMGNCNTLEHSWYQLFILPWMNIPHIWGHNSEAKASIKK